MARRYRRLSVTAALLEQWFKSERPELRSISNRLPEDARIVDVCMDPMQAGVVAFILESEEFGPLREGDAVPELEPPTFHAG